MKLRATLVGFALLVLTLSPVASFGEEIQKVALPLEVRHELKTSIDPDIKDLQWNRWTSENFTVCALSDIHARYLHKHLELVKGWVFTRWGLYDVPFSAECRVICVDDPALYEKMFKLRESHTEVRRDEQGKIRMSVIFLLADHKPSQVVPIPLTEVCLAEFGHRFGDEFSWWSYRGMGLLNGSVDQIKQSAINAGRGILLDKPIYFSKGLMEMTPAQWSQLSTEQRELYDQMSMIFCLLVRKEFGEEKFQWLLKKTANGGNPERALKEVCGFDSYKQFDASFLRYAKDLCQDIEAGKTPNDYLQISEK